MKKILFLGLITILLFGCLGGVIGENEEETIEKIEKEEQGEEMKEYNSIKEFTKENDVSGKVFEIEVDGENIKSRYGGVEGVYQESALVFYSEENKDDAYGFGTITSTESSEDEFYIIIKELNAKIRIEPDDKLRLFVGFSFEESFTKENAPSEHMKDLFDYNVLGKKVDFTLEKGKTYYMLVEVQDMEYGPPDEDGERSSKELTFIKISDMEFKDGEPQRKATPTFEGWMYG